jgi:hypothetical protein
MFLLSHIIIVYIARDKVGEQVFYFNLREPSEAIGPSNFVPKEFLASFSFDSNTSLVIILSSYIREWTYGIFMALTTWFILC